MLAARPSLSVVSRTVPAALGFPVSFIPFSLLRDSVYSTAVKCQSGSFRSPKAVKDGFGSISRCCTGLKPGVNEIKVCGPASIIATRLRDGDCGLCSERNQARRCMIRRLKAGGYRLYSRKKNPKTNKRRNLGTFKSLQAAKKHEREVQYFKRQ
jgi:hypothetical protein